MLQIDHKRVACTAFIVMAACAAEEDNLANDPALEDAALERVAGSAEIDVVPYVPPAMPAFTDDRMLEELSRSELAEALRPVILRGDGRLYIAREPNWPAADAAFGERAAQEDGVSAAPPSSSGQRPADLRTVAAVIGSDDRHRVTNTTIAPYRNIARVLIGFDDGGWAACSGSYIGPWTFIFAGHCVRQADGSVARRLVIEPGRNGSSLPFGSFDCRNDDATTANNFLLAIPSAFASSGDSNFDFAVVDTYPCHRAPHWFGEPATNQGVLVDAGTLTYNHYGYPGGTCPGAPGSGLYQCGMSGSGYVNGSWLESEYIDSSPGQSGGPWFVGSRVAGTLIGYREYFDLFRCGFDVCRRTFGRRIDGTFMSFLRAIAYDY